MVGKEVFGKKDTQGFVLPILWERIYDMPMITAVISSARNSANTYFILNGPYPCFPEEVAGMSIWSIPSETHLSEWIHHCTWTE
jgi:hypothetical protein